VGPHQIAKISNLLLSIELAAQIHKVQERAQAERDDEMLAEIKRKDSASVFFGVS
jgi:hypothetical protein